jgi:alpha-glucosidase
VINIARLLRGVSHIGLGNSLRTLATAREKDILDKKFQRRSSPLEGEPMPSGRLKEFNPRQDGADIRFEHADLEVSFLHAEIVRLTWTPGRLPVPYAIEVRDWTSPLVQSRPSAEAWEARGEMISIHGDQDGGIRFYNAAGNLMREDLPPIRKGTGWLHRGVRPPGVAVYGLGERAARLNLLGGRYRLWNQDPGGSYVPGNDPLHMSIPAYMCLHEGGSYQILYENTHDGTVSFDDALEASFAAGALRYYYISGSPARCIELYCMLTGLPPLPPRWALGFHQSRWGYKTAAEIREVVKGFLDHDLQISAIHLDIDYMDGYRVFTIDRDRFPDIGELAAELNQVGVKLVAIIDPGVKVDPGFPLCVEGLNEGLFCSREDGEPQRSLVWPGWVHFPDFTNPKARAWWAQQYSTLIENGIAGIWHDMNEPSAFTAWGEPTLPLSTRQCLEGMGGDHAEAHNIYGLMMNQAGYQAQQACNPDSRPFLLSRSGFAGVQRYAWNWTGDTSTSWKNLEQSIITMLGLGLSGIPYTGSDIGGFNGNPDDELFLRWFQMAAFTPFFRTHSVKTGIHREPWRFQPSTLESLRAILDMRYQFLPYIYTLAWEASRTGAPLMRPLFWTDPANGALRDVGDEFLLGRDVLVAPVIEHGARSRDILFPRGRWIDFWSGVERPGGISACIDAPLSSIPLFIRAGTILPLEEKEALVLRVYPGDDGRSDSLLYSDAGEGYGPSRLDRFIMQRFERSIRIDREWEGEFDLPYRDVVIELHDPRFHRVEVDGALVEVPGRRFSAGEFKRLQLHLDRG